MLPRKDIHAPRRTAVYIDTKNSRKVLAVTGNDHGSLWKRIPIKNCTGKKTEFIDVSTGIGRDIVFTMHVFRFSGRPNEGI